MTSDTSNKYYLGFFLALAAGLIWSFGAPTIRYMIDAQIYQWHYLFCRGIMVATVLVIFLLYKEGLAFRHNFRRVGLSGAPKIRAMEVINELEPSSRGIYGGAIGYVGWNGNMDTAIAIRTAVIKDNKIHVGAGAGIVADSIPENEWEECKQKSKVFIDAMEMIS